MGKGKKGNKGNGNMEVIQSAGLGKSKGKFDFSLALNLRDYAK